MAYEHPLIKEGVIEDRAYQVNIADVASKDSTLVVLPTGMGKTIIALMVIADVKNHNPDGKILLLAPTKPLVHQHAVDIEELMLLGKPAEFTGEVKPSLRAEQWNKNDVIVSTPQVIRNDLMSHSISLEDVALIVFDEAHRAVGGYAYVFIGERYKEEKGLSLGLTASPGSEAEQIISVCECLGFNQVEIRTKYDADVFNYVKKREYQWLTVSLPPKQRQIVNNLKDLRKKLLKDMQKHGFFKRKNLEYISKRDILKVNGKIRGLLNSGGKKHLYTAASVVASLLKLDHAIDLAETQGPDSLRDFVEKMENQAEGRGGTLASKRILNSDEFIRTMKLLEEVERDHPKIDKAIEEIREQLAQKNDSKVIAFTSYRHTAMKLKDKLNQVEGIKAARFVGQANKEGDKGLKQSEQIAAIEDFESGVYNVLVATSVGEEGLDIPATDLVLLFEPVASEIRTIQRRGRTARRRKGKVTVLITKNTRDEAYYWASKNKEKNMWNNLNQLKREIEEDIDKKLVKNNDAQETRVVTKKSKKELKKRFSKNTEILLDNKQRSLFDFNTDKEKKENVIEIVIDSREQNSRVVNELARKGIKIQTTQLSTGDYLISEDTVVERKSVEDFLSSLMDGRLFSQAKSLSTEFQNPMIIIEGEGLNHRRNIDERAIYGALASLATDFRIPVMMTKNESETASFINALLSRKKKKKGPVSLRKDKESMSNIDTKRFILEGLPNISGTLADRLLEHFGSVQAVFNADEDELKKVKGIGAKTAKKIVDLIR